MRFIGVLPAAGVAERLQPLAVAKELLPIGFVRDPETGTARPVPIAEHAIRAMADAGVDGCLLVISAHKTELMKHFGNGARFGLQLAYLDQERQEGLAAAVDEAHSWVENANVCLALPDTVFTPRSAVADVRRLLEESGADLVLGVFPARHPERLGPVRIDAATGRVLEVLEKPAVSPVANAWGVAAWTPRFTAFLHEAKSRRPGQSISLVFNDAVAAGFDVRAVSFEGGSYYDIGTIESLGALVLPPHGAAAGDAVAARR